jgi:hypothetical protein
VTVGDFNRDGNLDVVATGPLLYEVAVFIGNGDGTLRPCVDYSVVEPAVVVAGDFNEDGKPDLAVAHSSAGNLASGVSILTGNGDGTFKAPRSGGSLSDPLVPDYAIADTPAALAAADFNGDGHPDLVIATYSSGAFRFGATFGGTMSVLLGKGDGTFQAHHDFGGGVQGVPGGAALAVGDVNRDGAFDLIAANGTANSVVVLLGDGHGQFGGALDTLTDLYPNFLVAGDFNRDGKLDLAVGNTGVGGAAVALGNGDGTFSAAARTNSLTFTIDAIGAADFNGDGKPDLAAANHTTSCSIFLGNGDGSFQPHSDLDTQASPSAMTIGDLNNDGKMDIALGLGLGYTGFLGILIGNGNGSFQPITFPYSFPNGSFSLTARDFNHDGNLDIALTNDSTESLYIFLGNGDGTFRLPTTYRLGVSPGQIAVGDFNGDGSLDIAVPGIGFIVQKNVISILMGNGNGTFQPPVEYQAALAPTQVALGDFDRDGKTDLAVVGNAGISVFLGRGDGTFTQPAYFENGAISRAIIAADFNGDGQTDLAFTNSQLSTLSILLNTPSVALDPAHLIFGPQAGTTSARQAVTIWNPGIVPLPITSVTVSGDFRQTNDCPTHLAAGAHCTVDVTYQSASRRPEAGALIIADGSPSSPHRIGLKGAVSVRPGHHAR